MMMHFNTKPLTLDEVIAEHGDRIVRVHYSIDSADMLPTLVIKVTDRYLTTLRYINANNLWQLQAYTLDASIHEPRNDDAVRRVLDVVRKMGAP
jgi:molybdenum cofactor biosynthesis enzyme MoaA